MGAQYFVSRFFPAFVTLVFFRHWIAVLTSFSSNLSFVALCDFSRVTEWQIAVLGSAWVNFDIAFGNSANKVVVLKMLKMAGELKGRPEWEGPGGNHFIYDEYIDDHSESFTLFQF